MSKEHAKNFIQKAKTDPAIQKELHERGRHPVDVGREHGYHFSKEEFDEAMRERDAAPSYEAQWCSYA